MAKGHTIPLIDLTKSLLHLGLKVTFITTPSNQPFILSSLPTTSPLLHITTLPFPTSPSLPSLCESTDHLPSLDLYPTFLNLTKNLSRPFHALLQNLSSSAQLPLCVISDFFMGWTLDSCRAFGVPRLVSHGMSVFSMSICKSLWAHGPAWPNDGPFSVPGAPEHLRFTIADLPLTVRCVDPDNPVVRFLAETGEADAQSWGVIVNSFDGLDGDYAGLFESYYRAGSRAWFVGPLLFGCSRVGRDESGPDVARVTEWLDRRADGARELGEGAKRAVQPGGSSNVSLSGLIDELRRGLDGTDESGESVWKMMIHLVEDKQCKGLSTHTIFPGADPLLSPDLLPADLHYYHHRLYICTTTTTRKCIAMFLLIFA
ncbi:UDP-glycosyltransferase 73B5 [Acorus calamus]|uniref:UDP-glycosyltransferase 73B5 n=1 Tax=Acorus calamus TaxID=4465 RepID=A0AAV9CQ88_ACOCL|nr:UDP-glycosyltransferase 73B5 [Acorus calamus]